MRRIPFFGALILSACWGLGLSNMAWAQSPAEIHPKARESPQPLAVDVALSPTGVLSGQVVDQQGRPLPDRVVTIYRQGREVARAKTDAQGQFRMAEMTAGVYVIQSSGTEHVYRLWNSQVAPPVARNGAVLAADGPVVRGQIVGLSTSTLATTAVVGGAIVGGVLIYEEIDDNDNRPASP